MPLSPHVTQACQGVIHILQWWCPSCRCPLMRPRHARGSFTYCIGGVLHATVPLCDTGMLGGHSHITVVVSFMPLSPHATQACQGVSHILQWCVLHAAVPSCNTGMLGGHSYITVVLSFMPLSPHVTQACQGVIHILQLWCPSCRCPLMRHRHASGSFIYYSGAVLNAAVPSCDTGMLGGHSHITMAVSFMPLSPHATQA